MHIGIAGAGITGLTAAYYLSKKGHQITLFEKESIPGGLASSVPFGNTYIENIYHHMFTTDYSLMELIKELGLDTLIDWYNPSNGIYLKGKLHPFTTPMDLIRFSELPFIQRIRLGSLVYLSKLINNPYRLEKIPARKWIIKNAGRHVYEKLWGPLLKSKFDLDCDRISAAWIWNKFKLRGSTRSKGARKEQLAYIRGSLNRLCSKLIDEICKSGGTIRLNCGIESLSPNNDGTIKATSGNEVFVFDKFIFTAAPGLLEAVIPEYTIAEYKAKLQNIKYKANICMMLELKKSISDYYWITIAEEQAPFVLFIEHTNMIDDPEYASKVVYLSRYIDAEEPLFKASDKEIEVLFINYLKKMFPSWDSSDIKKSAVFRSEFAQPVVVMEYSKLLPEYSTPIKNLFLASMSQIYPEDRGVNYAVREGKLISEKLLNS